MRWSYSVIYWIFVCKAKEGLLLKYCYHELFFSIRSELYINWFRNIDNDTLLMDNQCIARHYVDWPTHYQLPLPPPILLCV